MRKDPDFRLTDRLRSCKESLQGWNGRVFGNVNKILRQKQNRLQQLEAIDGVLNKAEEIKTLKKETNETLIREEIMWKQRSRALWLKWGDCNIKFFHATASQRKRKNRIDGLQNQQGDQVENQEGIDSIILEYFTTIFKSDNLSSFDASLRAISNQFTAEMNEDLLAIFKAKEVQIALQQMHPTKALGPDGMSAVFIQKYWNAVGNDVICMFLNVYNSNMPMAEINRTNITLIPKTKNPTKMAKFRPISLSNVVYKLIAKVLANCLTTILSQIITKNHSVFLHEWQIIDNVLVAFELMHYLDHKRDGKDCYMAVKLNMSKAYNRVEWVSLRKLWSEWVFMKDGLVL